MKKIIFIIICLFSLTACGNSKLYKEKEKEVLNNDFSIVEEKIKVLNDKLLMFPSTELEDELITYILVIRNNKDRFTNDQMSEIKLIVTNDYQYELNSLGYKKEEVLKIIDELKK